MQCGSGRSGYYLLFEAVPFVRAMVHGVMYAHLLLLRRCSNFGLYPAVSIATLQGVYQFPHCFERGLLLLTLSIWDRHSWRNLY